MSRNNFAHQHKSFVEKWLLITSHSCTISAGIQQRLLQRHSGTKGLHVPSNPPFLRLLLAQARHASVVNSDILTGLPTVTTDADSKVQTLLALRTVISRILQTLWLPFHSVARGSWSWQLAPSL